MKEEICYNCLYDSSGRIGYYKDFLVINRFVDNLYPSTYSVAISSYIGLLPKIFSNNNRDKERIES